MKCVCCGNEMQKGTVSFMAVQGFGQMILSFASDENQKKSFFKRETPEKIVCSGEETEAYYCADCNKIMPVLNLE